ncbi:RNA polymerase sigma factor [Megamonas funiformis]|uniref:RNA polymerase sigma factor n=1 Tax=Megamonas funiformis TaxID=437897 RepID=UPI00399A231B
MDLIFENKESMYRLAYTIVENDADAQDAVGDAIVKAFGNIQRLRKKTSAKSWLMQILVNSAHDIVRKKQVEIVEKQLDDTAVTEAFESDEMLPIVMELKEEFREIIILYYYEEFSVVGKSQEC